MSATAYTSSSTEAKCPVNPPPPPPKPKCPSTLKYTPGALSMILVFVPDEDTAKVITCGVITNKMAACVNSIPNVTSSHEEEGEIKEVQELLLMIKTKTTKVDEVTKFVKENHPYEISEIISFPITNGNPLYMRWVSDLVP